MIKLENKLNGMIKGLYLLSIVICMLIVSLDVIATMAPELYASFNALLEYDFLDLFKGGKPTDLDNFVSIQFYDLK